MMDGNFCARFGGEYICLSSGVSHDRKNGSCISFSLCVLLCFDTKKCFSSIVIVGSTKIAGNILVGDERSI